jgi:uncharacterized protein (TIGR03437 family)
LWLGLASSWCQGQTIITTLAGTRYTLPPDGLPATAVGVGLVSGVTQDRGGNTYFSDLSNDRVYRIDTAGILTARAGNGTAGYAGDGGPATSASLLNPRGLASDGLGNLYICDAGNFRIRKVAPDGTISTIAGNGSSGYSGDGGPAAAATLGGNTRIALDSVFNIYISDPDNHRVRRITSDGIIRTFAGNGANASAGDGGTATLASLEAPAGLAFDAVGDLLIADGAANRVRRVAANGTIQTIAGTGVGAEGGDGGLATAARLNNPEGVAVDKSGAVLIADQNGNRIRRIDPITNDISTIAGTAQAGLTGDGGPPASASLYSPMDLFVTPEPALLVADFNNFRVRSITTGTIATIAGNGNYRYSGDGGIATSANLPSPDGIVVDAAGNLDICDNFANRIRTVNPFGIISLTAGTGTPGFGGDGGAATSALLIDCDGIAADGSGNLFFADTHNHRIRKISSGGTISTVAGTGASGFSGDGGLAVNAALAAPQGVAADTNGNVYIADTNNNRIRKVTSAGIISTIAGDGSQGFAGDGVPAAAAQLHGPSRVTTDASGNVYFSDNGNNAVRRISTDGTIRTLAGTGVSGFSGDGGPSRSATLSNPNGLAIDASGGVLIADTGNLRIRRVDQSGTISTIAGNGSTALSGDGRPPLSTGFGSPADVAVDSSGNIYIGDQSAGRVRRIQPAPSSLVLSEVGATFPAAVDAPAVTAKTLKIMNGGAGTIGWSAVSNVLSGSANWLAVSPSKGTSTSSAGTPVIVSANPAGLAPGNYYGQLEIASPGVANSPRFVTVVLNVLSASQTSGPSVSPAGFLFTGTLGGASPAAQNLTVSILHGAAQQVASSVAFGDANQWLALNPAAGSVAAGKPLTIALKPNTGGLAAGVYTATITLSFTDGSTRTIPATLTISAASATGTSVSSRAVTCAPTKLLPSASSLSSGFSLAAGWPVPIEATVVDDCGQPFTTGSVVATFTNGDAPLPLAGFQDGTWSATWAPRSAVSSVGVTITAQGTPATLRGSVQLSGQLNPNAEPPVIATGGILNAASFAAGEPATPGALMAIFGSNLAGGSASAASLPLPTQLAGTEVIIGGLTMPLLYASPTQINAMVPFTVAANTTQQVIVQSGITLSVPEGASVAPGAPAAFTRNGSGTGPAIVAAINPDGSAYIVTPTQPAHPGSVIVIYCAGLGGVQSSLIAGQATPLTPLAPVTDSVAVSVGGVTAPVIFAGLVPTFSGLYQVNATLPAGVPTGAAVPLVLTTSGLSGPAVSIAIQ